jgi:hypothetical protein
MQAVAASCLLVSCSIPALLSNEFEMEDGKDGGLHTVSKGLCITATYDVRINMECIMHKTMTNRYPCGQIMPVSIITCAASRDYSD